jgi:geranylgeranyl reductase family protein
MDHETPDILVVGLGPAGSRAAAVAAKAGYVVVAIERRAEAGCPVQCAEFVPGMIEREVPGVRSVTQQTIARMLTFTEDNAPSETPEFRGLMIDRAAFDRMLATEAADAGAQCRYGTSVLAIDADGRVRTSDGRTLRPRILIGCDGPRSRVGAAIGQVNHALVDTRQVSVPLVLPHDATDIFLSANYRGGYGWLFPKGAVANIGVGVAMEHRQRLKPLLDALFARLSAERRIGTSPFDLTGGAIPVGGRLRATGQLGSQLGRQLGRQLGPVPVLLAGDAAGLTNPVTGAGIASAVQSGTLAGQAAVDWLNGRSHAVDLYEEDLGDIFDAALGRAVRRRRQVLSRYDHGGRPDARALTDGWIGSPNYWAA